ncbi:GntR family transcriptional regulator [Paenibacillaceae bacterium]|nr:GntR family transcriptional regulator [Paenibacillaceae bacterium]
MKKSVSTEHLFMKIRNYVEQLINSREFPPDARLPTEEQLAGLFGVSRLTVKRALSELVDRGLIYRIKGKGTFVSSTADSERSDGLSPQPAARMATETSAVMPTEPVHSSGKSHPIAPTVSVILPDLHSRFGAAIVGGVHDRLAEHGLRVDLRLTHIDLERERQAIVDAVRWGSKGIILFPRSGEIYNEEILRLKIDRFPHVLIDRYLRGIDNHSVCSDNYEGAFQAVRRLTDSGHRHIGIMSHDIRTVETVEDRLHGAIAAINQAGGTVYTLCNVTGDWASLREAQPDEALIQQLRQFFRQNKKITAVITLHLTMAYAVVYTMKQLGRSIPNELSLITFDHPETPILQNPVLSCVTQNAQQLGATAADALVALLEGKQVEKRMIVPVSIIEGESIAPVKSTS